MITVRIAHAEPQPGRRVSGEEIDDPRLLARQDRGLFLRGFLVVLADDTGHRALPIWLAEDPWATPLPALLDRPGDDNWAMAGVPEKFAARLLSAAGASVSAVEIQAAGTDPDEVSTETCVARIEVSGPSGNGHVMARLDLGLTLAEAAGAPVWVPDAVMDRLAVPVPGGDLLAPFRRPAAEMDRAGVIVDRRAGRVFHVPDDLSGARPGWPASRQISAAACGAAISSPCCPTGPSRCTRPPRTGCPRRRNSTGRTRCARQWPACSRGNGAPWPCTTTPTCPPGRSGRRPGRPG